MKKLRGLRQTVAMGGQLEATRGNSNLGGSRDFEAISLAASLQLLASSSSLQQRLGARFGSKDEGAMPQDGDPHSVSFS